MAGEQGPGWSYSGYSAGRGLCDSEGGIGIGRTIAVAVVAVVAAAADFDR